MGPIIAVIATIVILFLAWMLLFRDGFGGDSGDNNVAETPAAEQEQEQEEPADTDINVNIPGGDATGGDDQSGAGDQGGDQPEGTGNDDGT